VISFCELFVFDVLFECGDNNGASRDDKGAKNTLLKVVNIVISSQQIHIENIVPFFPFH